MAADNCVHVVLVNPAGQLVERLSNYNPAQGSVGVENACVDWQGKWVQG